MERRRRGITPVPATRLPPPDLIRSDSGPIQLWREHPRMNVSSREPQSRNTASRSGRSSRAWRSGGRKGRRTGRGGEWEHQNASAVRMVGTASRPERGGYVPGCQARRKPVHSVLWWNELATLTDIGSRSTGCHAVRFRAAIHDRPAPAPFFSPSVGGGRLVK